MDLVDLVAQGDYIESELVEQNMVHTALKIRTNTTVLDSESQGALRSAVGALSAVSLHAAQQILALSDAELGHIIKAGLARVPDLSLRVSIDDPVVATDSRTVNLDVLEKAAQTSRQSLLETKEILSSEELCSALSISRQALSKAIQSNRMFSVNIGPQAYYPAFYAWPDLERKRLEEVTRLLGDLPGWTKWQFFTTQKGSLDKTTPLDALKRGKFDQVKKTAIAFAEK